MARICFQLLILQLIVCACVFGLFSKSKIQGRKYHLKQKVLTLGSSYTVKDDKNQPVYKVKRNTYINFYSIKFVFLFVSRLDLNN